MGLESNPELTNNIGTFMSPETESGLASLAEVEPVFIGQVAEQQYMVDGFVAQKVSDEIFVIDDKSALMLEPEVAEYAEYIDRKEMTITGLLLASAGLVAVTLTQRGGSLNNIKQNLIQQKKANAKKPMNSEQKKLRRRKRKK